MKKALFLLFLLSFASKLTAQSSKTGDSKYPPLVTFTNEEDHANMQQQLGIKTLRPGPSGNDSAPNHANYDESKANPCPILPDILTTNAGKKVTTADMWWKERRPELVKDIEREL